MTLSKFAVSEMRNGPRDHLPWSDAEIASLRQWWCVDGWTTRQIGDRMGRSRNAVLGKVHRLELVKAAAPGVPAAAMAAALAALGRPAASMPVPVAAPAVVPASDPGPRKDPRLCVTAGCRGTRQPGRHLCAGCITALRVPEIPTVNRGPASPVTPHQPRRRVS